MSGRDISTRGNDIIVGACGENGSSGNAYLFNGTTGTLIKYFSDPDGVANDNFGTAVAGIGNDIVIGANHNNSSPAPPTCMMAQRAISNIRSRVPTQQLDKRTILAFPSQRWAMRFWLVQSLRIKRICSTFPAHCCRPTRWVFVGRTVGFVGSNPFVYDYNNGYMFDASSQALLNTYSVGGDGALSATNVLMRGQGSEAALFDTASATLLHTFLDISPTSEGYIGGEALLGNNQNIVLGPTLDDTGSMNAGAVVVFQGVPEPSSFALLCAGAVAVLIGYASRRWAIPRRRRRGPILSGHFLSRRDCIR